MLFTIQAYLEDYLSKRNLVDSDGYAVRLANLYFYQRSSKDIPQFLRSVRRIKTVLFANNGIGNRAEFERSLVRRLDNNFQKKKAANVSRRYGVRKENHPALVEDNDRRLVRGIQTRS